MMMFLHAHSSRDSAPRWRAGLGVVTLLAATACHGPEPSGAAPRGAAPAGVPVTVAAVQRAPFAAVRTYTGNVQAQSSVNVLPKATGRIEQLFVDVGSVVQAGDPIAVLDR